MNFAIGLARILSRSKKVSIRYNHFYQFCATLTMPTATTKKLPNAGSKRKAELVKEFSTKGSKKPKIDHSRSKVVAPKSTKPAGKTVKAPIEQESSDDDFGDFDEDGGAGLGHDDTDKSNATPDQEQFHGVHPDRVKAAGNGAGPNGRNISSIYSPART